MKCWPVKPLLEVATIVSCRVEPFEGKRRYIATAGLNGSVLESMEEVDFAVAPFMSRSSAISFKIFAIVWLII